MVSDRNTVAEAREQLYWKMDLKWAMSTMRNDEITFFFSMKLYAILENCMEVTVKQRSTIVQTESGRKY